MNSAEIMHQPKFEGIGRPIDQQWMDSLSYEFDKIGGPLGFTFTPDPYPGLSYVTPMNVEKSSKKEGSLVQEGMSSADIVAELIKRGALYEEVALSGLNLFLRHINPTSPRFPTDSESYVKRLVARTTDMPDVQQRNPNDVVILNEKIAIRDGLLLVDPKPTGKRIANHKLSLGLVTRQEDNRLDNALLLRLSHSIPPYVPLLGIGRVN